MLFCLQDYDLFDLANEVDTLEQFLKLEVPPEEPPQSENDQVNQKMFLIFVYN